MIEIKYLQDLRGSERFGTCSGCGKGFKDDSSMVRVRFRYKNGVNEQGSAICLCSECRTELYQKI